MSKEEVLKLLNRLISTAITSKRYEQSEGLKERVEAMRIAVKCVERSKIE